MLVGAYSYAAQNPLQIQATSLVNLLQEHKQLAPADAFDYRSNRANIIDVVAQKRPDIHLLPFLYDAVLEKQSESAYYDDWQEDKDILLTLLNDLRESLWLNLLTYHPALDTLAQSYADYMYDNNHFDHRSLSGENIAARIQTVDYSYTMIGENLARWYNDPSKVLSGWYDSPTHRANLLEGSFVHMGLGRAGSYRVQLFGRP